MSSEPIIASDNAETALVVHGEEREEEEEESEESESEEEDADIDLPGAVDADRCTVGGPGANGGSAQVLINFLFMFVPIHHVAYVRIMLTTPEVQW